MKEIRKLPQHPGIYHLVRTKNADRRAISLFPIEKGALVRYNE